MSTVIDVHTPDGTGDRHVTSAQNGEVEVHDLSAGGLKIVGVHSTREVRGQDSSTVRVARRSEQALGTYPAGSRVEYIAR